jgi:hypothetical protein
LPAPMITRDFLQSVERFAVLAPADADALAQLE